MKRIAFLFTIITIIQSVSAVTMHAQGLNDPFDEDRVRAARNEFERERSCDPSTGKIPENMGALELDFARRHASTRSALKGQTILANDWSWRGPSNISGRTLAIGIDVSNPQVMLAGSTSGGVYRSTNEGLRWQRVTPLAEMPSVTCIAQDKRPGHTSTWYYGTGEMGGNTAGYPLWLNSGPYKWGDYYGNGIFKTTDNGSTWNVLPSTVSDTVGKYVHPFNFAHKIICDPSSADQDVVYAAVAGGIERSTDGGNTWTLVLGSFPQGPAFCSIDISSTGVLYALLSDGSAIWSGSSSHAGIFRSTNGIDWIDITPENWRGCSYYNDVIIAPSNENVVYFACDDATSANNNAFWKYTYVSGDGSGSGGIFEDRSENLQASGVSWVSCMSVKPDDPEVVYVGGLYLMRSTDAFATADNIAFMSSGLHVDIGTMVYSPIDPKQMFVGTDGGITMTQDVLLAANWRKMNDGYSTSQFYTVAIDHATADDPMIIGGLQDNSTNMTKWRDPNVQWAFLLGGDGSTCAVPDGGKTHYVSFQWGVTARQQLDENNELQEITQVNPPILSEYLFINPFKLDPANTNRMYMGGGNSLWRNNDLDRIPWGLDQPTKVGWQKLAGTTVYAAGPIRCLISAIGVSAKAPNDRVMFGTTDGQLFRIDNASVGDPQVIPIWKDKGLPAKSYVSSIAFDPRDGNKALVAFANYKIQSLFYTTDAGETWTHVGGDLEEFETGLGNGPACRTVAILPSGTLTKYLVGTTTGLYSTESLNGSTTRWSLEAADQIGHGIVNMIDTRPLDGTVAVATCGNGVFSGKFEAQSSVHSQDDVELALSAYPNPASEAIQIRISCPRSQAAELVILNSLGNTIATLWSGAINSEAVTVTWSTEGVANGAYYAQLKVGGLNKTLPIQIAR